MREPTGIETLIRLLAPILAMVGLHLVALVLLSRAASAGTLDIGSPWGIYNFAAPAALLITARLVMRKLDEDETPSEPARYVTLVWAAALIDLVAFAGLAWFTFA